MRTSSPSALAKARPAGPPPTMTTSLSSTLKDAWVDKSRFRWVKKGRRYILQPRQRDEMDVGFKVIKAAGGPGRGSKFLISRHVITITTLPFVYGSVHICCSCHWGIPTGSR